MRRPAIALLLFAASIRADVRPRAIPPRAIETGNVETWRFVLVNDAPVAEQRVPVTFSISNDELLSIPANCERSATRHDEVRCVVDIAASSISSELTFTIRTSTSLKFGRFGAAVTTIGSKSWRDEAILARDFVVTNVADSGAGSLRAAIEQVNQQCATNSDVSRDGPCRISFAIDAPLPPPGGTRSRRRRRCPR
jgi:hypothetical protein